MNEFLTELNSMDSKENHQKALDNLLVVYLCSIEANNQEERCATIALTCKLKELFM